MNTENNLYPIAKVGDTMFGVSQYAMGASKSVNGFVTALENIARGLIFDRPSEIIRLNKTFSDYVYTGYLLLLQPVVRWYFEAKKELEEIF